MPQCGSHFVITVPARPLLLQPTVALGVIGLACPLHALGQKMMRNVAP